MSRRSSETRGTGVDAGRGISSSSNAAPYAGARSAATEPRGRFNSSRLHVSSHPPAHPPEVQAPESRLSAPQVQRSELQKFRAPNRRLHDFVAVWIFVELLSHRTYATVLIYEFRAPDSRIHNFNGPNSNFYSFRAPDSRIHIFNGPNSNFYNFRALDSRIHYFNGPNSTLHSFRAPDCMLYEFTVPDSRIHNSKPPGSRFHNFRAPGSMLLEFNASDSTLHSFRAPGSTNSQLRNPGSRLRESQRRDESARLVHARSLRTTPRPRLHPSARGAQ
ncbi:unnamed protein product [Lampetra fluviatilis]